MYVRTEECVRSLKEESQATIADLGSARSRISLLETEIVKMETENKILISRISELEEMLEKQKISSTESEENFTKKYEILLDENEGTRCKYEEVKNIRKCNIFITSLFFSYLFFSK